MNFLAHLWLADHSQSSLAGAILGDMVRGRLDGSLPVEIERGVRIHRRIDAVTDHHAISLAWRSRFKPGARRYAGIVLDLLCDHALALDWPQHDTRPLADFAEDAARALAAERIWFERYGNWTPQVDRFSDLLLSYRQWSGYQLAVRRTASRLHRPQPLIEAARHSAALLPAVRQGLPELLAALLDAARAIQAGDAAESVSEAPYSANN